MCRRCEEQDISPHCTPELRGSSTVLTPQGSASEPGQSIASQHIGLFIYTHHAEKRMSHAASVNREGPPQRLRGAPQAAAGILSPRPSQPLAPHGRHAHGRAHLQCRLPPRLPVTELPVVCIPLLHLIGELQDALAFGALRDESGAHPRSAKAHAR